MSTKAKITIYTNETCPYCKQVKEKLDEEKIKYIEIDINKNEKEWSNIVGLTGMPNIPTLYFKDTYFVPGRDYQNPEVLIKLIHKYEPCSFDNLQIAVERVKTLNFGIATAFQQVDNLLKNIESRLDKIDTNYKNLFEDEHESTN